MRADPCWTDASAPKRTEHDKNKASEQRRNDADDRPRQLVAGRFDPEEHDRSQHKGDDPSQADHDGRVEGLDGEERDPDQHQGEASIVDRQQIEGIEAKQQADRADNPRGDRAGGHEFEDQAVDANH